MLSPPSPDVKLSSKPVGPLSNRDGKEDAALQVIRDNPKLPLGKTVAKLRELGIRRSKSWVGSKRFELLGRGVNVERG